MNNFQYGGDFAPNSASGYQPTAKELKSGIKFKQQVDSDAKNTIKRIAMWVSTITSTVSLAGILWLAIYEPKYASEGTTLYYAIAGLVVGLAFFICQKSDFVLVDKFLKHGITMAVAATLYRNFTFRQYLDCAQSSTLGFMGASLTVFTTIGGGIYLAQSVIKADKPKTITSELSGLRKQHAEALAPILSPIQKKLDNLSAERKLAVENKLGKNLAKEYLKGNEWGRQEAQKLGIAATEKEFEAKRKALESELAKTREKANAELSADEKLITASTQQSNEFGAMIDKSSKNFLFYVSLCSVVVFLLMVLVEAVGDAYDLYEKDIDKFLASAKRPKN